MTAIVSLVGIGVAFVAQLAIGAGDDVVGEHFRGILVADQFAHLWKLLLLLFVAGVILMWFTTVSQTMHEGDGPEFFALLLSATLGMSLMASTSNLLMLFLAVEMARCRATCWPGSARRTASGRRHRSSTSSSARQRVRSWFTG
jgi:NADH:ubiquinone oxidoreductase subunit 2 (subunit N)